MLEAPRTPRTRKVTIAAKAARVLAASAAIGGAAVAALGGCSSGTPKDGASCDSTERYFAEKVWAPIMAKKCILCHNRSGDAAERNAKFILREHSEPDFLGANLEAVRAFARVQDDGLPRILAKPTNRSVFAHGGGVQVEPGSAEYAALEGLVERLTKADRCTWNAEASLAGVELASWRETLRKAGLSLSGRLPTAAEDEIVAKYGESGVDAVIDSMTTEPAFYDRLKEIYNDLLLTDRYVNGRRGLQLLRDEDFPSLKWYESIDAGESVRLMREMGLRDVSQLGDLTNFAVAREPLELVAHVVRSNRPFTEILTANYIMVSPLSARVYGIDPEKGDRVRFENPLNPYELAEARVKIGKSDAPHAGILSSPMFLNRFPTTDTNRNRARARTVYSLFLGTDILALAEQPVDPAKLKDDDNPTLHEQYCKGCHAMIDPVAGTFASHDYQARYNAGAIWYRDMRQPGFGEETLKQSGTPISQGLPWLAKRVAADPRFALSTVFTIYTGLTGQKPLTAPKDPSAPGYGDAMRAYLAQSAVFKTVSQSFVESKYNLRAVVKGVVKSPYFRAKNGVGPGAANDVALGEVGTARFLTPELLSRKIKAIVGYPWKYGWSGDLLMQQYRLLYGGIDSDGTTTRITSPNGLMAAVAERMATEVACFTVARDFSLPAERRRLFPFIEIDITHDWAAKDAPSTPAPTDAIKKNIQYLHDRVLGETLAIGDPEIEATYELFMSSWRSLKTHTRQLQWACQARDDMYTGKRLENPVTEDTDFQIRSWMAVMTYLLSDYKFLYE